MGSLNEKNTPHGILEISKIWSYHLNYMKMPFFTIIMNNKFLGMFWNSHILLWQINFKNLIHFIYQFIGLPSHFCCSPVSSSQWTQSDACRLKTVGGSSRLWSDRKHQFSGEQFIQTCIIEKLIITHQEPTEGIQVWILLGYASNILGYASKYCNYTSKRKLGRFPH